MIRPTTAVLGVFGLAMLPLRGWLLGLNPPLLVALTGSRSGTAALGALSAHGELLEGVTMTDKRLPP